MKSYIILIFTILISELALAQDISIRGKVADETLQPLPMANVVALLPDSSFVAGSITNEQGLYNLTLPQEGEYIIRIQLMGYEPYTKSVKTTGSQELDVIALKTASYMLTDVLVIANKPLVRREVDRIIFDPQNLVGAQNVTDLLRVAPAVMIDGDNISMFGSKGVKFYINGKEQKLSANDMLQVLKSYPSEDVDKIEIITDPGSRYAANGGYGIIDIKLKKKANDYIGGSVSYSRSQYEGHNDQANANLLYKKNKWSASLNAGGNWKKAPYIEMNTTTMGNIWKTSETDGSIRDKGAFVKSQVDYQLTDKVTIGVYAMYKKGNRALDTDDTALYHSIDNKADIRSSSVLARSENTDNIAANVNVEQKIGTKGATIWYNIDYYHLSTDDDTDSHTTSSLLQSSLPSEITRYGNIIDQRVNNYSGKIDATIPFGKNTINAGAQYSSTVNTRDYDFQSTLLSDRQYDLFDYKEHVMALYVEYQRKLTKALSLSIGSRIESTWTEGENKSIQETHRNNDTRFFPNFKLGYRFGSHYFGLSLSNWVERPNMYHVNPNVIQRDKYSRIVGNPDLKYSYVYKAALSYSLSYYLMADLFYAVQPDKFSGVVSVDNNMLRTTRWENALDSRMAGINIFYYFDKIKWMNITLAQGVVWSRDESMSEYTLPNYELINYVATLNTQFFFNKSRSLIGTVWGSFTSKDKTIQRELDPMYKLSFQLQYTLLNNKLTVALGCDNILASRIKGKEFSKDAVMVFNNKFQYAQPKITLTYRFGANIRSKRHDLESDKIKNRLINDF